LASYSITRIITKIAGKNNILKVDNKNKWLKKLNNNFTFIETSNDKKWQIINTNVEPNFKIKNFKDIKDFKKTFPNSKFAETKLSNSINVFNRSDIPKVLKLYPNTKNKTHYQLRYYNLSKNVSELKTAKSLYPESRSKFTICSNINTIIKSSNKSDLDYLINEYSNSNCIDKINNAYVGKCSNILECFNMSKEHPNLINQLSLKAISFAKTINDFDELYKKFPNRKNLIESKASLMANSIDDLKKVYNDFEGISKAKKSEIETKALSLASSIADLNKIYIEFDSIPSAFKNQLEIKALSLASSIEDLSRVYNVFDGVSLIAEQEALYMASTIVKKKEFLQYFPNSPNSSHINQLIKSEEKNIAYFKKIANVSAETIPDEFEDKFSNYAMNGVNYGMSSYSYEDGFVRISVGVRMHFYLKIGGSEGSDNKLVSLFNIFSNFSSNAGKTPKHKVNITYDLILYPNRKPKMTNYHESGISNLESRDAGLKNISNSIRKTMRETASYNYSTSYYDNEKPCYVIIDKSTNFISRTISYEVKCRDGDTEIINYYPNKGEYSNTLLSPLFTKHTSFSEAIKDYCGCN